jgi:plastocyanin
VTGTRILGGLVTATAVLTLAIAPAEAGTTILLKDDRFAPKTLSVKKGTTVTFKWTGKHPHNVVGSGAATFRSGTKTSGTYRRTLRKKGTVKVLCELHSGMKTTIKVG